MVEHVSTTSSIHNTIAADTQEVGWKSRLDKSMISLEQQTREFNKKLQPQISNINKLISSELDDMQSKKSQLGEQFKNKLDEYKKVSFMSRRRVTFVRYISIHSQINLLSISLYIYYMPRNSLNSSRRNIASLLRIQSY